MPSPVFRSPINPLSQENRLSGSFNSQHQAYDETTYVDSSTIIGGTPINNYTDHGAGTRTSEVDYDANFTVNIPSGHKASSFNVQTNDIFNLNVFYTNCDCLTMAKKEELYSLIETKNPDIIALSEILPKNSILPIVEEYYNIDNYDRVIFNIDKGRGVVLYVYKEFLSLT